MPNSPFPKKLDEEVVLQALEHLKTKGSGEGDYLKEILDYITENHPSLLSFCSSAVLVIRGYQHPTVSKPDVAWTSGFFYALRLLLEQSKRDHGNSSDDQ